MADQIPGMKPVESPFVAIVTKSLAKFWKAINPTPDKTTEAPPRLPSQPGVNSYFQTWHELYSDLMGEGVTRAEKYAQFNYLDKNLAEAAATLNVYSDNIVSGTIGGEESFSVWINEKTKNIKKLEEIVDAADKNTRIKDQVWEIARNLTKNGDDFLEVVVEQVDGETRLQKLKELPVRTVEAYVDERGVFRDPSKPYVQRLEHVGAQPIQLDWWRVIHFKVGNAVYGIENSLFANASLRIGRQLIWIDEALVLARLSRAWQRFAYFIDTGKLGPDDAMDFVTRFMQRLKQRRTIADKTTGATTLIDAPLMPDEDIGIPVGENSKASVQTLSGDPNIGRVEDVRYLQNKFLMAVTMPKAYVSLEEGVNARATMNQLDVQFARQVRRRQNSMVPGLRKFYELAFIFAGVDPESFEWEIQFPEMSTSDEQMKWEMMMLKAQVAKMLAIDIGVVNDDYVLREILGFDNQEVEDYGKEIPEPQPPMGGGFGGGAPAGAVPGSAGKGTPVPAKKGGKVQLPPQTASMINKDPEVRRIVDDLRDLVAYKLNREAVLEGKVPVGTPWKRNKNGTE